jgi:uncharacterized protein (TIGR02266 family)
MLKKADDVFGREERQCPRCGEIIGDAYMEQNPFPEFPCPSCASLVDASFLKSVATAAPDKRTGERLNATIEVSYASYDEFITEYTGNVSEGGLFIHTNRQHKVGETVDLFLVVPGLDIPVKIKGQIIHIEINSVLHESAGAGVKFLDITSESRKTLIDFIKSRDHFK